MPYAVPSSMPAMGIAQGSEMPTAHDTATAPDSDVHDGRPRYTLFDDGETEIASGAPARAISPLSARHETANDRDEATTLTAPSYLGEIGVPVRGSGLDLRSYEDNMEIDDDRATYSTSPRLGIRRI